MNLKPTAFKVSRMFWKFNGRYRRVTRVARDSLAANDLFTVRNRPILINISWGLKIPTHPLNWPITISTDLDDSQDRSRVN